MPRATSPGRSTRRSIPPLLVAALIVVALAPTADARRHVPPEREMLEGHEMITLLDWGDIPPIDAPDFATTAEADDFMMDSEPVIGITDTAGDHPRCYSLLQLDHHEVVNDHVGDAHISVTW